MVNKSKNRKRVNAIVEKIINGSRSYAEYVGMVTKAINVRCGDFRAIVNVEDINNGDVLYNKLANAYNAAVGAFPSEFRGFVKKSEKRVEYIGRLMKIVNRAIDSVYSNGNSLDGMSKEEVLSAMGMFWEAVV